MNEALKSVIHFGFNKLDLSKIEAFTHSENQSSIRLLEKNNFHLMEDSRDENNPNNIIFVIKNPITTR